MHRPSIIPKFQRAWNVYEAAACRSIVSSTPGRQRRNPQICLLCNQRSYCARRLHGSQQRWASQTATANDTVQTPRIPQTHYEFFPKTLPAGPPPSGPFPIDLQVLRKEFLQLQAVAHPDRHASHLKSRAEATSARINEAYKTLQDPLARAQYILGLKGMDVAEDETAKVEDPELLMEVLDTREKIEDAQQEEELKELKATNAAKITESERILDKAFANNDLNMAKSEAMRLRYWVNIKESLDGWEMGKPVVLVH